MLGRETVRACVVSLFWGVPSKVSLGCFSRVPLCLLVIAIDIQPPSWLVDFSSPVCLALGFDFGTAAQVFERNLRLLFTPVWSPFWSMVSEPVKHHSTLIGP